MTDSILIVGSGITGLHAAVECANAGAHAIVIEQEPVVGGKLAAPMTEATAIGARAEGTPTPLLEDLAANENIEIITLANLERIEGRPGNFTVSIRERARLVTDACTRCNLCRAVCPVIVANEFDAGLTYRKAIYTPLSETLPGAFVIDIDSCLNAPPNYLPCQRCVEVCDDDAIHFHMPLDTVHERQVGAVILAPGFQIESGKNYTGLGYGTHPDIVMSAELQRLLESPGPTGGYASKPSNEEYPDSVLLVLDNPSHFSLYIAASQVHQLIEQDVGTVAVLVLSSPAGASDYPEVPELVQKTGIGVQWGMMFKVDPTPENTLNVSYENLSTHQYTQKSYDMVVLCSDVKPPEGLAQLAKTAGIDLADNGYIAVADDNDAGVTTSEPGVFVAGCASGPKNIKSCIAAAHSATSSALTQLNPNLLEPDYVTEHQSVAPNTTPPISADATRARIEQLLYALLDKT